MLQAMTKYKKTNERAMLFSNTLRSSLRFWCRVTYDLNNISASTYNYYSLLHSSTLKAGSYTNIPLPLQQSFSQAIANEHA